MYSKASALRALLGLVAAALLACPATAGSNQQKNVTYLGTVYEIYKQDGNATTLALVNTTFWVADAATAAAACNLIKGSLGGPNEGGDTGPYFLYYFDDTSFSAYAFDTDAVCSDMTGLVTDDVTFALSTELGPEPSPELSPSAEASPEASPSPSPAPLDCSLATFSPPILSSAVTGKICAASTAVRRGEQSKLVTNVTLSLLDGSNQPATVNITDIVTNKATAGWQCKCRPTKRDNCTCLPNAWLLGGGNFLVMPQWRRTTRPGSIVDTTLQVSFTATADNGDTCAGTAVICSAWNVPRNGPPPACTAFNSTGVTRPALTCI